VSANGSENARDLVTLGPSVRFLAAGPNVIRLRWGIWNFQEATLDLSSEPANIQAAVRAFFEDILEREGGDPTFADISGLSPLEKANLGSVVAQLRQAGFLAFRRPGGDGASMARALLGNLDLYAGSEPVGGRVGFLSDSTSAISYMEAQGSAIGAKLEIAPGIVADHLRQADFTSGMGGPVANDLMTAIAVELEPYDAIVACISQASMHVLRNLNRVALHMQRPLIIGLIDGPFSTVLGIDTPSTGCIECFEQRSLSRLEDHIGYHDFFRHGGDYSSPVSSTSNGVESLLCAFLLNESVLLGALGTSRFIGRALSVYLPTYEMQAQDVMRIVTCPACGHVARDISEELGFSSRVVIDRHVREALGGI